MRVFGPWGRGQPVIAAALPNSRATQLARHKARTEVLEPGRRNRPARSSGIQLGDLRAWQGTGVDTHVIDGAIDELVVHVGSDAQLRAGVPSGRIDTSVLELAVHVQAQPSSRRVVDRGQVRPPVQLRQTVGEHRLPTGVDVGWWSSSQPTG